MMHCWMLPEINQVPTITIIAATSLNPRGHARAIDLTAAAIPHPCKKILISPVDVRGFDGQQLRLPEPWAHNGKWSLDNMCDFLLTGLHNYISDGVAIVVHDDGYALNQSRWSDEFLKYDYIGAPWPKCFRWSNPEFRVGNGGFSLRSKKWLVTASQIGKIPPRTAEDVYANVTRGRDFLAAGCRIAPLYVAARWSFEHPIEEFPNWRLSDSLGFHGLTSQFPERRGLKL